MAKKIQKENEIILCNDCVYNKDKRCIHKSNFKIAIARKVQKIAYKHGIDLTACDYYRSAASV